jgi:hypothetical protein
MASVVVCGGGAIGLATGLLLPTLPSGISDRAHLLELVRV